MLITVNLKMKSWDGIVKKIMRIVISNNFCYLMYMMVETGNSMWYNVHDAYIIHASYIHPIYELPLDIIPSQSP